jgi:hypothetical protein
MYVIDVYVMSKCEACVCDLVHVIYVHVICVHVMSKVEMFGD